MTGRGSFAEHAQGREPSQAAETPDRSTPEQGPDDAVQRPEPGRSNPAGSRLALRNWRISTRLVSLIALPVVAASALGAFRIQESMESIEQLDNMQLLTDMTQQATLLASALQEERDRSAGPLVSGQNAKTDDVAAPRERTDRAREAFSNSALKIDDQDEVMAGIESRVTEIGRKLNKLKEIRSEAYDDPQYISQTVDRYSELIESLLGLSQDMALATNNSNMIESTRALAAFSTAKEQASIQRAMVTGGFARSETDDAAAGFSTSDWRYGRTSWENEVASRRSFFELYGDDARAEELLAPLEGGIVNVVATDQLLGSVFSEPEAITGIDRTYKDFYDTSRTKIEEMDNIERTLLDEMERQAQALREDARNEAILNGALIVLVLGISLVGAFVVARSMVRSLRRLQDTAQEVAHRRLPEVVKQMSEADPQDVDTSVESVGVHTRDEIGSVAQAFDEVHREAVRLAGEQALLRGNVNAMFTNLSRRSQGLIQRQLSLISELESREADPDQLASLFKLDHLATRMRRNGENLLVLAGEEPGRRWTRPVPLVDVLRAAASEVEQYERIELSAVPKADVAGRVVNDLVHLLAELLENATSFSSPQTKVKVTGHALPDGRVLVEIHDTGIGLSPEDLAEINDRLANPPTVDVSVSRRMGLFVVGRLSLRHGIRIQLRPSDSGGTTALVMLPAEVTQGGRGKPGGDQAARPGGPAAATLRRESPLPRRQPEQGPAGPLPSRGQVPGSPARAALPSRPGGPGAQAPGGAPAAGGPGNAGAPTGPAAPSAPSVFSPAGNRPSWATDDGGRPAQAPDADGPRGHDDATRAFGRPAPRGEIPAQQPQPGPADTGEYPRPAQPGPADTGEYPRPAQPGPADTGEYPRPAQPRPADTGEFRAPGRGAEDTGAYPAMRAPEPGLPSTPPHASGDAPERSPIFEELESTWFGSRNRPGQSIPSTESAGSPHATQRPAVSPPRGERASTMPPTAPGRPLRAESGTADAAPQWRSTPNDERWRRAEQLKEPSAGGVTTSGLPRRVPRANLMAGTAQPGDSKPTGPQVSRAPSDVRGRLTNLRRGIQQGRQAGTSSGRDGGHGSSYGQER